MVDKATFDLLLDALRRYTEVLSGLRSAPREAFLANPDKVGNAKYHFVIAIECAIDVALHVIAWERYRFARAVARHFAEG